MRRSQVGSAFGTSRSTPKKRRLIKYSQRPGPYHAAQGGVLNPHKYPNWVIGTSPNLIADDKLFSRQDLGDGESVSIGDLVLTVSAGTNQVLAAAATVATLTGTASSNAPNDTPFKVLWTIVSGLGTPVLASPGTLITGVSGLVPGVTTFKLTVTGHSGDTSSSMVTVTAS